MVYDAIVALATASTLIPLVLYLAYVVLRYATEGEEHELKRLRYEAGNPPSGRAYKPMLFQYFGYILLFVALDPVFMLLFALLTAAETQAKILASLAVVLAILPPLFYALKYVKRMEYWRL